MLKKRPTWLRISWTGAAWLVCAALNPTAFAQSNSTSTSAKALAKNPVKATAPASQSTATKQRTPARRVRPQATPAADRIREIQTALRDAGYLASEPTGKWDAASADALKRFQQANEITPTGKLDARTLQKLGLGSPVAGVSPPRRTVGERGSADNPK
jgi:peptidoglycan hydrolase-like protein with peptidoglycan-binding domain